MSEFNFKSQICTDKNQSERLLALGLKKETADMCWLDFALTSDYDDWRLEPIYKDWEDWQKYGIPAWSLHRLIELAYGNWKEDIAPIYLGNSYDMLIERIKFQVKQGKFNKEYLV